MLSYDTKQVLLQYWKDIGSPCALALRNYVASGSWDKVVAILNSLDQTKWMSPYRHRLARLSTDIIKKADYLPLDVDRGEACITSFLKAEEICRVTNRRFQLIEMNHSSIEVADIKLVKKVKRLMSRYLGSIPDLQNIEGTFGPGATLSNPRSRSSIFEKLECTNPTITQECALFYPALPARLRDCWGPVDQLSYAVANRFVMVPKNFKTNRGICVEPLINAYVQRYFGLHIKKRLRMIGIDIDTASVRHRNLARESSVTGAYATIDMSMASDTVARGVIEAVLPHEWFRLLDESRCKYTDCTSVFDEYYHVFEEAGVTHPIMELNKFSSMGNGFTFELETLLFVCIARACGDASAISFGDDLIIKTQYYRRVMHALQLFGFVPNSEKSYATGSFRESCGGDFRAGVDVKGETLKTEPTCVTDWYDLHNRLFVMGKRFNLDLSRTLNAIRRQVPLQYRLDIPVWYGTGGFFHENPKGRYRNSILHYKTYRRTEYQSNKDWASDFCETTILAAIFLGGTSSGPSQGRRARGKMEWDPPLI